jgi:phospholipase/carboxylesterase
MHKKQFITAGKNLEDASKVLIMIHGRGASAEDILTLADHFEVNDFALIAPQATNHTWYPYSFLVTRHATKYGGVGAFTGGLIGDKIYSENYAGDFSGTPVFIGSSDPDPHVPAARVNETAEILEKMNALVTKKIYKNMGHTINQDELSTVNKMIFTKEEMQS